MTVIYIIILLYMLWIVLMIIGYYGLYGSITFKRSEEYPKVSVLVPFRNESQHLSKLVKSLSAQQYENNKLEILLINDHSDDDYTLPSLPPFIRVIQLPEGQQGKKAAITHGLGQSKGDIIITTDADCWHHPNWVQSIVDNFDEETQMVFGGVRFTPDNKWLTNWQMLEFAPVILSGAAMNYFKLPLTCNGANLAYRKSAFKVTDGYTEDEIPTGDDQLLMNKLSEKFNKGIKYNTNKSGVVSTYAPMTCTDLISQKRRWASKWKIGPWQNTFLALLIFMAAISFFISIISLMYAFNTITISLVIIKILLEGVLVWLSMRMLSFPFPASLFFIGQILYPIYVIYVAITVNFGGYKWKGRSY